MRRETGVVEGDAHATATESRGRSNAGAAAAIVVGGGDSGATGGVASTG